MEKKYLFVAGLGRSGTTALVRLLSAHRDIVLGVERFKRLNKPPRSKHLRPSLFEKESFFNFDDNNTNITPDSLNRWAQHYEAMRKKYDQAIYVGDKAWYRAFHTISEQFPQPKFVLIVRDIYEVAHSWNVRARNAADRWPAEHDAFAAVTEWNQMLQAGLDLLGSTRSTTLPVDYGSLFGDSSGRQLQRIMTFLELEPDDGIREAFAKSQTTYLNVVKEKQRDLREDELAFIEASARFDLQKQLLAAR